MYGLCITDMFTTVLSRKNGTLGSTEVYSFNILKHVGERDPFTCKDLGKLHTFIQFLTISQILIESLLFV